MNKITVDFGAIVGKVKPMHSVNNGPVYKFTDDQRMTNFDAYRDAGIPYARNHDAAFYPTYGGEHSNDISGIFPDFNANPYDPASYDFELTDEYMKVINLAGTETFFRLGQKIEHAKKKYHIFPPADYHKWAVICEHIIMHYNYGWANGSYYGFKYWEIWNEPDLGYSDVAVNKKCWQGTPDEFYEFFNVVLKHLKGKFPELKIGGPAACTVWSDKWLPGLFEKLEVKPDFFSWHWYGSKVSDVKESVQRARELLDRYGLYECESILNEWNYIKGWTGDEWVYSLKTEKSIKGAAFIAAVMSECQKEPIEHLMYYDARPCVMNGMFNDYQEKLKGYYPFYIFNKLYKLENSVMSESDTDNLYVSAAAKDGECAAMISYYDDDGSASEKEAAISLDGMPCGKKKIEIYAVDSERDLELVRCEYTEAESVCIYQEMPENSICYLSVTAK